MHEKKAAVVTIEDLDRENRRFCVSYPITDERLSSSIAAVGMIQPLLVMGCPPYTIVTGFKRLEAAIELGWTEIPCLITDMNEREALLSAIHDNVIRGLNIVEKSLALLKMVRLGFDNQDILDAMTLLTLSPHEKVLSTLTALASSDEVLKDLTLTKRLSLRNIDALMRFEPEERNEIISLLSGLHTTESSLREVLHLLRLARLKKGPIDFGALSTDLAVSGGTEEIRKRLKYAVMPKLSELEEKLALIRQNCALPPGIDIKVDPFFEKEYIDVSIRARRPEDLKAAAEKLETLLEASHIRSILELTRG